MPNTLLDPAELLSKLEELPTLKAFQEKRQELEAKIEPSCSDTVWELILEWEASWVHFTHKVVEILCEEQEVITQPGQKIRLLFECEDDVLWINAVVLEGRLALIHFGDWLHFALITKPRNGYHLRIVTMSEQLIPMYEEDTNWEEVALDAAQMSFVDFVAKYLPQSSRHDFFQYDPSGRKYY